MIDELDRNIRTALGAILDLAPESDAPLPRRPTPSRRVVTVAAGFIVVASVAAAAWLSGRSETTRPSVSAPSTVTASPATEESTIPQSSTSTSTTTSGPSDTVTELPDLAIDPSELVAQTPEQAATLSRGIEVAIRACMAEAGFDYHLQKVHVFPPRPRILDDAWRRQYGYGFPRMDGSDPEWDAWITSAQKNPAFMRALIGSDANAQIGGCTETAYLQIYPPNGSAVSPQNDTFNKEAAAFNVRTYGPADRRPTRVLDPELEATRAAWSTCMKATGVNAFTPGELASRYLSARPSQRSDEGVTQEEIAIALQDWQCEVSTGFLQHWYGRLQQLTAAFASERADVIDQIQQWNRDATARAQRIIDANP